MINSADVYAIVRRRVYPVRMPLNSALPSVVYEMTLEPVNSLSGDSGIDICRMTVNCWASSYLMAQVLAQAVRNTLIATAGIKVVTVSQRDEQDLETLNYSVVTEFTIWSVFDGGAMNPILEYVTHTFDGDGVTTIFTFPSLFREGTLLVFKNGSLIESGTQYTEAVDRSGISFTVAPEGGDNVDKFVAYYAKS
jgi:hypothetical protein